MFSRRTVVALLILLTAAAGCRSRSTTTSEPPTRSDKVTNRQLTLFFETPQMTLGGETRTLPLPEDDGAAFAPILRELAKGPTLPALLPLLPKDTEVRAAYLLPDGNAIIDLGGPTLAAGWNSGSHDELMALYSIVETVTVNFPAVRRVRVLVNGQVTDTFGGHVRIDRPLNRAILAAAAKR